MIKPLTSLRFFFALMVFMSHLQFFSRSDIRFHTLYNKVFYEGYLGVSFFFILSGFILSLNYKEKILDRRNAFKEFWVARVARIYPLHLLTLFLSVPLSLSLFETGFMQGLLKFFSNALLLQGFIPSQEFYYSFNAPSWSISCEMFFYLLFPFAIALLSRNKRNHLFIPFFLIAVLVGIWLTPATSQKPFFYINPVLRFADFLIGIMAYEWYEKGLLKKVFGSFKSATVMESLSIMLFVLFFVFHDRVPQGFRYSCYYWIPMTGIILSFAYHAGAFSKILSGSLLVLMGEISYGIYLIHHLVIRYINELNGRFTLTDNDYVLTLIMFVLTITAANLTYRFFEKPINKLIKQRFSTNYSGGKKIVMSGA